MRKIYLPDVDCELLAVIEYITPDDKVTLWEILDDGRYIVANMSDDSGKATIFPTLVQAYDVYSECVERLSFRFLKQ
jgi:hypothetical protein